MVFFRVYASETKVGAKLLLDVNVVPLWNLILILINSGI